MDASIKNPKISLRNFGLKIYAGKTE